MSKTSKFDRGSSSKIQEEMSVEVKKKIPQNQSDPLEKPLQLKTEMTHLTLSDQAREKILDTIKFLSGEDFEAKSRTAYEDKKKNLSNQYWVDRGNLMIQGTTDYSAIKRKPLLPHEKVSIFALNRLKNYGFHNIHCVEALQLKKGDVGQAFELLMSYYMHVPLPDPETEVSQELLSARSDEFSSIKLIYDDIIEEKIPKQLWVMHLDLPYISDNYLEKTIESTAPSLKLNQNEKRKAKPCMFFQRGGCRYGVQCRLAHDQPKVPVVTKSAPQEIHDELRNKYDLEIRFPQGCLYPKKPPLVAFSPCSSASLMPSTARLRLSYYLQNYCKERDNSDLPYVFDLIDQLRESREEILKVINERGPSPCILDPSVPLCPEENVNAMEQLESDEEMENLQLQAESNKEKLVNRVSRDDDELTKQFQRKQASARYKSLVNRRRELPAYNMYEEILNAVNSSQVVVVSGATGCGKSTQVPQYLLDQWLQKRLQGDKSHVEIVCTQPRRLSAIGVAERVAFERVEHVGLSVGYQIRLESKVSSKTRLTFCTTGILLRRLESDPLLLSVSHIIVDEVHERSEESDFLLLILKKLLPLRPDLHVILMSATLNANLFCKYFNDVPVIDIPGKTFQVEQLFLEDIIETSGFVLEEYSQFSRKLNKTTLNMLESLETELELADIQSGDMITNNRVSDQNLTIRQLFYRYKGYSKSTCKSIYLMDLEKINYELIESVLLWIVEGDHSYPKEGSILVFLPGMQEIKEVHDLLSNHRCFNSRNGKYKLIPLHSSLSSEEQAEIFSKPKEGVRKIVLSTNIAETSVTIDDCVFVVDSGRMKEKRFDSNKNMESLETVWVSRANVLQRKGRAGRVMPGVCIHLYTQHHYDYHLTSQPIPEILRVPLEQIILRIKMIPSFSEETLLQVLGGILEPPSEESITGAITRLFHVGALDREENLTPLGRHLAALPVDVRIGKLLLYGAMFSCLDSVLTIAASLSQKSPFIMPFDRKDEVNQKKKEFTVANSDHFTILRAFNGWRKAYSESNQAGYVFANENFMSVRTLFTLVGIKAQFLDYLVSIGFVPENCRMRNKRSGKDTIIQLTGPELNTNGENYRLLAGLLSASLYPNIVRVLSPEKFYAHSIAGAVPKESKPEELKFKTKSDGYVFLHPSSVNYNIGNFSSPYLVFQEKIKTSKVFIRDCTMVPVLPLVMFSGNELSVELTNGTFTISLEDGWIVFVVNNNTVGELLQIMQRELLKLMAQKIKDPSLNLNTDPKGKKILDTITYLVTKG